MESGAYFTLKNYPMALLKIDSCIQYFEQSKNPRFLQGVFHDKSLPLIAMNRYDEAEFWAKKELELAKTSNSNYHAYKAYLQLSEIEQGRHNFEKALNYFKLYSTLKDTVFNQNLQAKLAEEHTRQNIDAEHEARRKAELQSKVLKTTNQLYATVAASLLLMLLLGGYLFTKLQKTRKLLEVQNIHLNLLNQTKDKFFGIIAHDLRNPLSSFMGTSEQLTYYLEKGDVEKVKIAGDLISKSAANLNGLLDNLLSWALLNRGLISINPQALSLAAESSAVIEIQENALAAKNITLENRIPDGLKAMADSNAFQTILRNLIGNAVKFTPKNGLITIDAEQNKENVLIRIQDTGMGMSEEKLAQLFTLDKRSERGTAGEKGTNLGLIICKELVELHNGALRATSKEGEGSSFEFSLPKIITS
jgi:signal transduction histidine kinase